MNYQTDKNTNKKLYSKWVPSKMISSKTLHAVFFVVGLTHALRSFQKPYFHNSLLFNKAYF